MNKSLMILTVLCSAAIPCLAHADDTSSLARIEVSRGKQVESYAVTIHPSGEWGEVDVDKNGAHAKVKARLVNRPGAPVTGLAYEVTLSGGDRSGYAARGESTLPAAGKRVVLSRGGDVEVTLVLTPAHD